jgi:hypothetical protein
MFSNNTFKNKKIDFNCKQLIIYTKQTNTKQTMIAVINCVVFARMGSTRARMGSTRARMGKTSARMGNIKTSAGMGNAIKNIFTRPKKTDAEVDEALRAWDASLRIKEEDYTKRMCQQDFDNRIEQIEWDMVFAAEKQSKMRTDEIAFVKSFIKREDYMLKLGRSFKEGSITARKMSKYIIIYLIYRYRRGDTGMEPYNSNEFKAFKTFINQTKTLDCF